MRTSLLFASLLAVPSVYSNPHFTDEGAHVLDGIDKQHDSPTLKAKDELETSSSLKPDVSSYGTKTSKTSNKSPSQTNFPSEANVITVPVGVTTSNPSQEELDMELKKGLLAQDGSPAVLMGNEGPLPPSSHLSTSLASEDSNSLANNQMTGVSSVILVPMMGLIGLVMAGVGLVFKHYKEHALTQQRIKAEQDELMELVA